MASRAEDTFSVFRIAKNAYIRDRKGEGAFKYGGRWSPRGYHVLYTSASRSLAFCEYLANLHISVFPPNLSVREVEIPCRTKIQELPTAQLPRDWRNPFSAACRRAGEKWLKQATAAVLKVPSAVIKDECNYVLNTTHPDFSTFRFKRPEYFRPDARIMQKIKR